MYFNGKISNYEFKIFLNAVCTFLDTDEIECQWTECYGRKAIDGPIYDWNEIQHAFTKIRDIKNELFAKHGAAFTLFQTQYECIKLFNANHHIKEMPDTIEEYICILGYSIEQVKK